MLKAATRTGKYVFGTKHGNRYTHVWDDCKESAKKAKLNEEDFFPHKFRATYATKLLQSGIDLKTVQKLLGHKNLECTMRYLAKAQTAVVKKQVDAVWQRSPAG
jgi:integrase/recombinase XerD